MALAGRGGLLLGKRIKHTGGEHPQFGILLSAILAILGLLLSFTFAGSMSRFGDRQGLLVAEANAIGTAWLRADLVAEPHRTQLRSLLREYTDARITLFNTPVDKEAVPVRQNLQDLQTRIWSTAIAAVKDQPIITAPVLDPLNELFDLLSVRNDASQRHTPWFVLIVLCVCAVAAMTTVGFGLASATKRIGIHAAVLGFLIAATLWVTIDMDYLSFGLIRISKQPLLELKDSISSATP
jgi:hypothetical protein